MLRFCLFFVLFSTAATTSSSTTTTTEVTTATETTTAETATTDTTPTTTAPPTTSACMDQINPATGRSDCPRRANLCNNSIYFQLMTQQCPSTCGRCGAAQATTLPTTATCMDRVNPSNGRSDCPSRANLCNNTLYFQLMTIQCPRTCGRCQ